MLLIDNFRAVITSLLTQIPTLFSHIKNPEPALLPTIDAALSALQSTGGKIICSLASLPTWGPGRLVMRDHTQGQAPDGEKKLFGIENPEWKKTATKLAESGVGIDFFIASPGGAFLDVTTIGKGFLCLD
jgi:protein transport protein SEC24